MLARRLQKYCYGDKMVRGVIDIYQSFSNDLIQCTVEFNSRYSLFMHQYIHLFKLIYCTLVVMYSTDNKIDVLINILSKTTANYIIFLDIYIIYTFKL